MYTYMWSYIRTDIYIHVPIYVQILYIHVHTENSAPFFLSAFLNFCNVSFLSARLIINSAGKENA